MNKQDSSTKKLILLAVAAIVVIVGGVLLGTYGAMESSVSQASLIAMKVDHNFGDIDIFGGKVTAEYPIANESDEPIDILWGKTTCMCTEGFIDGKKFGMHEGFIGKVTVNPGETKMLKAVFDPMAHGPDAVGSIKRVLTLGTNSETTPQIELKFEGNVVKENT